MIGFALRRMLRAVPLALLAASLVFALLHLVPGDPAELMLGDGAQAADVAALRRQLGLDRPLLTQYLGFVAGLLRGDLGTSLHSGEPVAAMISAHLPATLELALASIALAIAVAVPLGTVAAFARGGWVDRGARLLALVGVSMPSFWLGPVLILAFAIHWSLLPVSGRQGPASLVLPAVTLATGLTALLLRMVRASLLAELGRPYLRTARAKGLGAGAAVARHALRNALVPVVTVIGLQVGSLLTGSIITESIFSWPGLGRLLIQGIRWRDFPLVQGCVLYIALIYVAVNVATDLVCAVIDPRLRGLNGDRDA